ncbi:MAG: S53 family peptidase, partial [Candidatus Eremiobacteraeota bacterium]|nr:S53 family peptidase [Candidatus Eremiobacteraeota bacterium]
FQTPAAFIVVPYGGEVLAGARYLGPARVGGMHVDVIMRMRDEAGLRRYAQMVSDPHSVYYRRFLTPQQIGDRFGAPRDEYEKAIHYFWSQGLSTRSWAQREAVAVSGSQAALERAFHTRLGLFAKNGTTFFAPLTAPRLHAPLAVAGLGGMETYQLMRIRRHLRYGIQPRPLADFPPGVWVGASPFDLAAAFDYTGAYGINGSCCKGDSINIAIVGTGPIYANGSGTQGDTVAFRSLLHVSGTGTVKVVPGTINAPWMSTGLQPPPPVTGPCGGALPSCNPEDIEAQLDTEQSSSLAPDANVLFYLSYNPNECFRSGPCPPGTGTPRIGIDEADDELEQIANDDVADVVSGSYGIDERDIAGSSGGLLNADGTGLEPTLFATLASQGITVFFSSGDSGAESCQPFTSSPYRDRLCVSYPSGDPNVVSVGGTTTPIASNGQLSGILSAWGRQTMTGGGGGGFSLTFARPSYQPAGTFCADDGECDSSHRLQPDLALNGDPNTGVTILLNSGPGMGGTMIGSIGGTSASAPGMAAMWALVVEACKQTVSCSHGFGGHAYRFGNPKPLLYGLSAASRQAAFFDVVYGNNAVQSTTSSSYDPGFNAGVGFDLTTGLGAPFGRNLIKAVVGL